MTKQCSNCDHFGGIDCLRYPTPVAKTPSDTCGEWKNDKLETEMRSKKETLHD